MGSLRTIVRASDEFQPFVSKLTIIMVSSAGLTLSRDSTAGFSLVRAGRQPGLDLPPAPGASRSWETLRVPLADAKVLGARDLKGKR